MDSSKKWKMKVILLLLCISSIKSDLTIHLIAHSHMDPGWIKTDYEYYSGEVVRIYDTVYAAMMNDPQRKFVFAEIVNFKRWYESKPNEVKENVKKMVKNGRIEIVGGGYVMNDEATPHYQDIIDQMRFGMKFCMEEFGVLSNTQWTIDPFGHSAAHALLMSQLGFKQIVVNRIHYQDYKERLNSGRLQFIYRPFNNKLGKKILYHVIPYHYGQGQCNFCANENPPPRDSMSIERSATFMLERLDRIRKGFTNKDIIMHLMGDDFTYTNEGRFKRNELVMEYINTHKYHGETVKIFYSTPREYFNAIYEENDINKKKIPIEGNIDFYPYADMRYAYWTGYFTSRPYLKGIIRKISNFLYSYSMMMAESKISEKTSKVDVLNKVRGVSAHMQHHDAVTGTSKERISSDFISMCQNQMNDASRQIKTILERSLLNGNGNQEIKTCLSNGIVDLGCNAVSETQFIDDEAVIAVYHPQVEGKLLVTIELKDSSYTYSVSKDNQEIQSDYYCLSSTDVQYDNKCFLNFFYDFKPSISVYFFKLKRTAGTSESQFDKFSMSEPSTLIESQGLIEKLEYIPDNNSFNLLFKNKKNYTFSLDYQLVLGHSRNGYIPNDQSDNPDADDSYFWPPQHKPYNYNGDGAYIFSPNMTTLKTSKLLKENLYLFSGKLGVSLILNYETAGRMIVTFYSDPCFVKVDHIMNKVRDTRGINFLFRVKTDLNNLQKIKNGKEKTEFWTDSNGFNMMRRVRDLYANYKDNHEEAIATNFYPVTSCISIRERKDNNYNKDDFENFSLDDRTVSVFNDKSQSGSSLEKGEILLLIQRTSRDDDSRGVAEALYEELSVNRNFKFTHIITFGSKKEFSENVKPETFVYNYMHNSPVIISRNSLVQKDISSKLNEIFIINGKNIRQNVEIVNDKLIIVQFYNHFDNYFEGFEEQSTGVVEVIPEKLKGEIIVMTDYNGLKYINLEGKDLIKFLISKKSRVIIGQNDITYFYLYIN